MPRRLTRCHVSDRIQLYPQAFAPARRSAGALLTGRLAFAGNLDG